MDKHSHVAFNPMDYCLTCGMRADHSIHEGHEPRKPRRHILTNDDVQAAKRRPYRGEAPENIDVVMLAGSEFRGTLYFQDVPMTMSANLAHYAVEQGVARYVCCDHPLNVIQRNFVTAAKRAEQELSNALDARDGLI